MITPAKARGDALAHRFVVDRTPLPHAPAATVSGYDPARGAEVIEAGRAFMLWTGLQGDLSHRSPDPAVRQKAADYMALVTPVVKAFITEPGSYRKIAPGIRAMSFTPERYFSSFSRSRSSMRRSFFV